MLIDFKKIPILWYGGIIKNREKKLLTMLKNNGLTAKHIDTTIHDIKRIGCFMSHMRALNEAINIKGPVLIIEDDINITEHYNNISEIRDDTDAFYYGTCHNGLHPYWLLAGPEGGCCWDPIAIETYPSYYRICGMLTAHAILYLSDKYKQETYEVLQRINGARHVDVVLASRMHLYKVYAAKKPFFFQDCEKDNLDAFLKTKAPLEQLLG